MKTRVLPLGLVFLLSLASGTSLVYALGQGSGSLIYGANYEASTSGMVINIYVDNTGTTPVFPYASHPYYSVTVYSGGKEVWSSTYGHFYPMIIAPVEIEPGITQWTVTWNYVTNEGEPVPSGTYSVVVYALGHEVTIFDIQISWSSTGIPLVNPPTGSNQVQQNVVSWLPSISSSGSVWKFSEKGKSDIFSFKKFAVSNFTRFLEDLNATSRFVVLASNNASVISEGFGREAPNVAMVFVINSASISFYRVDAKTGKWSSVTLPSLNFTVIRTAAASGGSQERGAGSSLFIGKILQAAQSGNAAEFYQVLGQYLRNATFMKKQIWREISQENSQGRSTSIVIQMLKGAIHLNFTVERQFELTEKMGIAVSNAAERAYQEGLSNLTEAKSIISSSIQPGGPMIPANSAGEAVVNSAAVITGGYEFSTAIQYLKSAMKDFQKALIINAQSRAGPKPKLEVHELRAAWAVENATANMLKGDAAAVPYIEQARVYLDAAESAPSQAQYLIAQAMHELALALQTYGQTS
ncbi:MAG: BsuPI-related putative proteinase inhibitor [Thermoprotei archaeon]